MTLKEKFDKAVNVIRNLPKNGSYQPSHELQLRFYAYFKQATVGPNCYAKPNFWEVVNRAKWDAWSKLGNMTKDEAMMHYVEELRTIVETMSYTDNVANFVNSLDNFYDNVPAEDLEMLVGPVIEKIRSRPNSPLNGSSLESRETSPTRNLAPHQVRSRSSTVNGSTKHFTSSLDTSPASSYSASPQPIDTDDDEDEHFLDTQTEPDKGKETAINKSRPNDTTIKRSLSSASCHSSDKREQRVDIGFGTKKNSTPDKRISSRLENTANNQQKQIKTLENCNGVIPKEVQGQNSLQGELGSVVTCEAFKKAISQMTEDIENLQRRMAALENENSLKADAVSIFKRDGAVISKWWDLSLPTTAALLIWPVFILLTSKWMTNRRKQ